MIRSKALIFKTFWEIKRPNDFDQNQKSSHKIEPDIVLLGNIDLKNCDCLRNIQIYTTYDFMLIERKCAMNG